MKTRISPVIVLMFLVTTLNAQLKAAENGYVGICIGDTVPLSNLSVGGEVTTQATLSVTSYKSYGVYGYNNAVLDWTQGLYGRAALTCNKHVGVLGLAYNNTPLSSCRAYGVLGVAGNATSG